MRLQRILLFVRGGTTQVLKIGLLWLYYKGEDDRLAWLDYTVAGEY